LNRVTPSPATTIVILSLEEAIYFFWPTPEIINQLLGLSHFFFFFFFFFFFSSSLARATNPLPRFLED